MYRPRVIPCLLLKGQGLVKTIQFTSSRYIGDPINAVHIFNSKKADELIFLDIMATREGREPPLYLIEKIGDECFMPFAVGGGIRSLELIRELLRIGTEKVILNSIAVENPRFVEDASGSFGKTTIVVSMDVKKTKFGGYEVRTHGGTKKTGLDPLAFAEAAQMMGAGELFITSIDRDGKMNGYDLDLIRSISRSVDIPVIASGGAGSFSDIVEVVTKGEASAAAAGSYFVFHGPRRAVLISFSTRQELASLREH